MKQKKNYIYIFLLVLACLSLAGTAAVYPMLPEQIPTHFDFSGNVDTYGPKATIFVMAALPLIMLLMVWVMPKIDPRRKNYDKHKKAYTIISLLIVIFPIPLSWATIFQAMGYDMNINMFVSTVVGILLIVMGNFMPQIRPNYFMGIRTPWTLDNPQVWRKTHTLGGIVFCIMGVSLIVAPFLPEVIGMPMNFVVMLGGVLLTFVYSFIIYKKYKGGNDTENDHDA